MKNKGPAYVLACYVLWGVLPIFWRTLSDVPSLYLLAQRIMWSLLLVLCILTVRRGWGKIRAVLRDRGELKRLVLAGVLICINWGAYIWAVNSGHMLDASLAYYMNPILSILLGTLMFRERLTRLQWVSVAVTAAGLAITMLRYGQFPWIAVVIGGSFALYGAVKKKVTAESDTAMLFETAVLAPLALLYILWAESRGAGAVGVLQGARWMLLPLAGVVTTVPLLFFAQGIKTTPMTLSGVLMYINPTLQLLIGVLLYHEEFTATHAILFGFVWTGLVLYLLAGMRKNHQKKETNPCE